MPDTTWIAGGKIEATGPTKFDLALAWIRKNRETFIGSLVIVVVALIFSVYFFVHYRGLRDTAWKTLFMAQQVGYSGNIAQAQQQLASIETSYGSTSAAPYATLSKGDIFYAQGKYKEAAVEYAKVLTNRDLAPFALYNVAKSKEAEGDLAAAQLQYADFLAKYPDHFIAPEAHASLARAQELAGSADLARSSYERIALLYPDTNWALLAKAKTQASAKK